MTASPLTVVITDGRGHASSCFELDGAIPDDVPGHHASRVDRVRALVEAHDGDLEAAKKALRRSLDEPGGDRDGLSDQVTVDGNTVRITDPDYWEK